MKREFISAKRRRVVCQAAAILLLSSLGAAVGCSGSSTQQASDEVQGATSSQHEALVAELDAELPELLRGVAQERANRLTIETILDAPEQHYDGIELSQADLLRELYGRNGHSMVWVEADGASAELRPGARELLGALREGVEAHGLWRDELHLDRLEMVEFRADDSQTSPAFAGVSLDEADRDAIVDWLVEQDDTYSADDDLQKLLAELVSSGRPLDRLQMPVSEQASRLSATAETTSRIDVLFSDAFVQYARRMRYDNPAWQRGKEWPERLQGAVQEDGQSGETEDDNPPSPDNANEASGKSEALSEEELEEARGRYLLLEALGPVFEDPSRAAGVLTDLPPRFEQYKRLAEAFRRYKKIVDGGGWPHIPDAAEGLKRGTTSEHITTVKERLRIEGYYDGDDSDEFGDDLRRALLRYQSTHQLWENGWLTPQTMSSINETATERWNQIRLTLQRWRESRVGPDTHYVHVNIPDFHASVWKESERQMRFKVVVGATTKKKTEDGETYFRHATPRFSDEMEYLVFNPYWNVPKSIQKKELEPKFEKNPEEFEEKGYEYYTDENGHKFLRQKPGPQNALGRVKFIFPNPYAVYLHDTPQKQLFKHPFRAYSHGCVRVQNPMEFAHYLLDLDGRWKDDKREEKLDEWFAKESPTWVKLRQSLPIHLEYYVVRVDDDGHANFLADLYRLDRPRLAEIAEKVERLREEQPVDDQTKRAQTAQSESR